MADTDLDTIDPTEHAQALAERDTARRRLAIAEAGVDIATPLGRLFASGYDGDLTDTAITAAWAAVQPPAAEAPAEAPPETVEPPAPGTTELEVRQGLAAEGLIATEGEDPLDEIMRNVNPRHTEAQRLTSAAKKLMDAGFGGDQRVMVTARQAARFNEYIDPAP